MTHRPCCKLSHGAHKRTLARRALGLAGGLAPGAALLLLPKCPICLAAYLTLATGIGITASAAGLVRPLLAAVFTLSLAIIALRILRRFLRRGDAAPRTRRAA